MINKLSKEHEAIREGTHDAFIALMEATGGYPFTREDILAAIREGVRQAAHDYIEAHGLGQ